MVAILGDIVVELFVNRATINDGGQVAYIREELPVQKNLRFDRNTTSELDTCNFQFYDDKVSEISQLDIVEIFIYNRLPDDSRTLVDKYVYQVIEIKIDNVDRDKGTWNHLVSATECTKRLEGYYLTRDFSQPLPNELETPDGELPSNAEILPYDGYTNRLKMIEEAKRLCYPRKEQDIAFINIRPWDYIEGDTTLDPDYMNGEDNSKTTYARLSEELGTEAIARVVASNDNLRDVVDKIFSSYGASARIDYIGTSFVLKADNQNEITSEVNISRHAKTNIIRSINGYGTFANPELQNIVGQDSIATNGQAGRPFQSDTTFTLTNTAKIVVDYPIKDIIKVEVARLNSNEWVDITKYIIKNDQRRFLPRKGSAFVNNDDIYIDNVASYTEGQNEISGFGDEYEGETFPFIGASVDSCWEAILDSTNSNDTLDTDIRLCRARVQYRTLTTEKVQIFKNDFSEQKHLYGAPINESDQTLDFKRAGISLQDKIEKTGTQTQDIDIILNNEIIQKGINYYDIKQVDIASQMVIVNVENTLINGNLKTKYTLAKGGYLNAQVVVDSLKRASAIESGLVREFIINDFVNINFTPQDNVVESSLTAEGMQKFMDTFRTTNTIQANVDGAILVSNELLNVVAVPVSKHLTKDYAKVGFTANNPVHLGYQQGANNEKKAVRYALRNGVMDELGLAYGLSETQSESTGYNKALPEISFNISDEVEPIVGTKLINLGDTNATDGGFENLEEISDEDETSRSGSILAFETRSALLDTTLRLDRQDGKTLIPRRIEMSGSGSATGVPYENVASASWTLFIDGAEVESGNNFATIQLDDYGRRQSVELRVNLSYGVDNTSGNAGQFTASVSAKIVCATEDIIPPVEGERDTTLRVLKNPNEVLGISHGLNCIKDRQIITGQALMTKNSLYTNHNYDSFVVYGSETEFYTEGDETPKGIDVGVGDGITISQSQQYGIVRMNYLRSDVGYKSLGVFGIINGNPELLVSVNAEYGSVIPIQESALQLLPIYFQFSSKARGLIME